MNGISDLSKAVEIIMNNYKSLFKADLTNMMAWRLAKSVEESMNEFLIGNGSMVNVDELGSAMNATLIGDPIFRPGFMAVPMDGSFQGEI